MEELSAIFPDEVKADFNASGLDLSVPWKDSEIDKVARFSIVRDEKSFLIWAPRWYEMLTSSANVGIPDEFPYLTVYCASYLPNLTKGSGYLISDESLIFRDSSNIMDHFATSPRMVEFTTGKEPKVWDAAMLKKVVPFLALFCFRPFYRPGLVLNENMPERLALALKNIMNITYTEKISINENAWELMKNQLKVTKTLMNSVLVPVIKLATRYSKENETTAPLDSSEAGMLRFCILLHTWCHGMPTIARLHEISRDTGLTPGSITNSLCEPFVETEYRVLVDFLKRHLSEPKSKMYEYSRALNDTYEQCISNMKVRHYYVMTAYLVNSSLTEGVFTSEGIKRIGKKVVNDAIEAAHPVKILIDKAKHTRKDGELQRKITEIRSGPSYTVPKWDEAAAERKTQDVITTKAQRMTNLILGRPKQT